MRYDSELVDRERDANSVLRARIRELEQRLAAATKQYDELKHVVECNKKLLVENDDLTARLAVAEAALARSPYDISPCLLCGAPVVCLPDGMPMCQPCAESEAALEGKP